MIRVFRLLTKIIRGLKIPKTLRIRLTYLLNLMMKTQMG